MSKTPDSLAWWEQKSPAETISWLVTQLESKYSATHDRWRRQLAAYLGRPVSSLSPQDYIRESSAEFRRSPKNVVRSLVNTVLNRTVSSKARASFAPVGADPSIRYKAQQLEQFIDGLVSHHKLLVTPRMHLILDALIYGSGLQYVTWKAPAEGKRADIVVSRLMPWQLLYECGECQNGSAPRSIYITRLVPRSELIATYPKLEHAIRMLPVSTSPTQTIACRGVISGDQRVYDYVRVIEAIHLPSASKAKDGRIAYVSGDLTLDVRPYEHDEFPLVTLNWTPAPVGWVLEAPSLVEEVLDTQRELDITTEKVRTAHRKAPSFIFLPQDSGIPEEKITNDPEYPILVGMHPPQIINQPAVDQATIQHEDRLKDQMYELSGVSQMSATGQKEPGVESGRAITALADETDARMSAWRQSVSSTAPQTAQAMLISAINAEEAGYQVESFQRDADHVVPLRFQDFRLEKHQFVIQLQAVNNLPKTLSGQLELAQTLVKNGMLPPQDALGLLTDLTDVSSAVRVQDAEKRAVELDVEAILAKGEPRLPDSYDNVPYAYDYARRQYLLWRRALDEGDPKLELLQQYIDAAQALMPPPPGAMPMDPAAALPEGAM